MSRQTEPLKVVVPLGGVDASGPDVRGVFVSSTPVRIVGAYLVDSGASKTGHGTNYGKYTLYNKGAAGAGTAVVASRYTDTPTTDDMTQYVAWPLTLSATKSLLEVGALETLVFEASETGSATSGDLTDATLHLEFAEGTGGGI